MSAPTRDQNTAAPVPSTGVDPAGETFAANADSPRALVDELTAKPVGARLDGPAKSRARHVERGKLLPRDRVDTLLDTSSPFLELSPWPRTASTTPLADPVFGAFRM